VKLALMMIDHHLPLVAGFVLQQITHFWHRQKHNKSV
jgi:hypothetical protein